jgi:hypothetical protein
VSVYKITHGTAYDTNPDRDIVQDIKDTHAKMMAIMGNAMPKQAFVLTDGELAVLKSIVPTQSSDWTPMLGGIEVHSRKTVAECQELTAMLRAQGYDVTTTETKRYEPLDLEWPILDATESIDPYRFHFESPYTLIGVPAHILHGNDSGFSYAAERERHERFFGPPTGRPQETQAEEDS